MKNIDPFTRTPGVAGAAFINMHYADEIISQFESELSSKYIFKIVGLRGSGKSVEYRKIMNSFSSMEKWLVYSLSSAGDPTQTLIANLSSESFIDAKKHSTSVSAGGSLEGDAAIIKGSGNLSVTKASEENPLFFSPEAALVQMVQTANDRGYRILVGIDDISKSQEMIRFLSIWGSMLLDDRKKIYLICTGLSKNIEDFAGEPNLTFFKRSDLIEIKGLDKFEIASMYRKLLHVNETESVKLAKFTRGYAYAYQVLGSLYFNKKPDEDLDQLLIDFDRILFRDSYDLIWKSLTAAEQEFVKAAIHSDTGKASEIKALMKSPRSYDSLRQRLENKHLINTQERGYIRIDLPRFREYVTLWHEDDDY